MTEREKLIKLLRESKASFENALPEEIADYIIENGVIVSPCKMGDTIYEVIGSHYIKSVVCAIHISDGSRNRCNHKSESYIVARNKNTNYVKHYNINKFGKTVFLTREEAEKCIKRGENE